MKPLILTFAVLMHCMAGLAQDIPLDPDLRSGKLPNGFSYYIRHNTQPRKHVELYLVNKVGSILEDEDQRGLAHFIEHMNFNGTKNYPKNELVNYLQKAGVRFGADLNAYTGFDETVYQLPLPTDDPAMFPAGLNIMRDWAQEALLDPQEIERERGIILEEKRLGKGAMDRINRQTLPLLVNYTRYASRLPIGTDEVLTSFRPEQIRRFYQDWYRPNLQALIIVGDIDPVEAERLVKAKFSDLKNPASEKERIFYHIPLPGKRQFIAVCDNEETNTNLQVVFKRQASNIVTQQDYRLAIRRNLLNELINSRQRIQLAEQSGQAFSEVSIGISRLLANIEGFIFQVTAKDGKLKQAFEQSWRVLEGIKRFGFSQQELERAKLNYLSRLKYTLNEQGKIPSANYVKEYQQLFLHREASPGNAWEYSFSNEEIAKITLEDLQQMLDGYLSAKDVDIILTAPEKDRAGLPAEQTINNWISAIGAGEIKAFQPANPLHKSLMDQLPQPGRIVSRENIAQIGVTRLTLSNGIRVILKPTDFKNDEILYRAFSPGGASLYDGADFDMAMSAAGLVSSMGFGSIPAGELDQVLAGKLVKSAAGVSLRSTTINGSASPKDIEAALQLTYLQFTAPRKDKLIFDNAIDKSLAGLANRYNDPGQVFADSVSYVMNSYNYRYAPLTQQRIRAVNLDRTCEIFRECFSDASGFTFVFVGNFKPESIEPLLERYLGALPASYKAQQARDLGIHIPKGRFIKKVYKGLENKASVRLVLSGDFKFNPENTMRLKALTEILQIRLLERLREAEGEVYSPQVVSGYNKYPRNRFVMIIQFGCAPQNVAHLASLVEDEMRKLTQEGPAELDIEKFKAQYRKTTEPIFRDNGFWAGYLLSQCENGESLLQVQELLTRADELDRSVLKKAARQFLSGENLIRFELLPEPVGSK